MLAVALLADVTDTPVWVLGGVTFLLVIATGVLAGAAIKALLKLKVALQELEEISVTVRSWFSTTSAAAGKDAR